MTFRPGPMHLLPRIPRAALSGGETLSVAEDETSVDVFCFFYEDVTEPALLASYDAMMMDEERARERRFYFEKDRRLFLATRALVRSVLSLYEPSVLPKDWRFLLGSHGKPYIAPDLLSKPLYFNLTNTRGLVACAVSRAHEHLGIDVENMERHGETVAIADRFFAPTEIAALRALPEGDQRERFFSYWTLKESYIKARGLGLAIPLDGFAFSLEEHGAISIAFEPSRVKDDAARYRFENFRASPHHLLSLGADTNGAPLFLRASRIIPERDLLPFVDALELGT